MTPEPHPKIIDHTFTIHVNVNDLADSFVEELVMANGREVERRRIVFGGLAGKSSFQTVALMALAHHEQMMKMAKGGHHGA